MGSFNLVRIKSIQPGHYPSKAELAASYQLFCEFLRHLDGFGHSPLPLYKHYILQQLDDSRYNRDMSDILIMEPRSHAKTTVDVIPYAPWRWLSEPWLRVGVFSAGEKHSKKITRGIIKIVERLEKLGYYQLREKPKKQELTLVHDRPYLDPSLECYPIQGSSSVGSGKDIIIADDVYTIENADSDIKADDVKQRYDNLTDLWREYRYPQRITIGTRLHHSDLYDDILRAGTTRVLWFPIIPPEFIKQLPVRIENIKQAEEVRKLCIWPEIIPAQKLMSAYNSPRRWNTQYMLQPLSSAVPIFLRENILCTESIGTTSMFEYEKLAIVIDPAVGSLNKAKGDNCAILVGGVGKDGLWHIVDGWFSNTFTVEEMTVAWKQLVTKWCRTNNSGRVIYPRTVVEAAGQQALFANSLRQAAMDEPMRGKCEFHMQTTGNIKKDLRVEGFLSPIISRRNFIIHRSPISQELLTELVQFPGYRYKDVADGAAALVKFLARFDARWLAILKGESGELFSA